MAGRRAALALVLGLAVLIGGHAAVAAGDGSDSDIVLRDVTVSLLEASGSASSTQKVSGPDSRATFVLDHTRTLKVSFHAALKSDAATDFRPQQAFLRLTSRDSGGAAYFAAVRAKDGSMYATAKSADVQKQVGLQSGAYEAALIVGDTRAAKGQVMALGEVQVLHPPLDDGSQPTATAYRAISTLFKPQREITHMHRPAERRAPSVVSLAFTALAVAPTVLFVGAALRGGANFKAFPASGTGFLSAVGFHAGLAAICGLYLLYWVKLNLMQTVPILVAMAAVTSAFGGSLLKQLASVRQKQE